MEYNKILEEAKVNEMILEKANDAAEDVLCSAEETAVKGYKGIEGAVVGGYKGIEHAAVGGYQKIENAFVSGWEKVEDACVDVLFRKEGETAQEAVARLKASAAAAAEAHTQEGRRAKP